MEQSKIKTIEQEQTSKRNYGLERYFATLFEFGGVAVTSVAIATQTAHYQQLDTKEKFALTMMVGAGCALYASARNLYSVNLKNEIRRELKAELTNRSGEELSDKVSS